ncbi:hypothetical protein [Nocardia inohanensis]|uniref:hypothetical protein n=1 Tax=Nocardia inohanensis TaxID=209246 RepID=UPI00082B2BB4|nr:hypothetical protein [Nocardia inohanensis]
MGITDTIVATTFDAVARLRRGRVFHPAGRSVTGMLVVRDPQFEYLLGATERPVLARISKGTGLPGRIPDVLGLAIRVPDRRDRPWDFTFATTSALPLLRWLPVPARGWRTAHYGSLMPYRIDGGPLTWLYAEPDAAQPQSAGLTDFVADLQARPAGFELIGRERTGPRRVLGELILTAPATGDIPDHFDPILNRPAEAELLPETLATVREWAYTGSREGRGSGTADALPPARL